MNELVFQKSATKLLTILLCGLVFVAPPFFLAGRSLSLQIVRWLGAAFFAPCCARTIRALLSKKPAMKFTMSGFEAECYGIPVVSWEEVETTWKRKSNSVDFLCIKLRNSENLLARLSALRRRASQLNRRLDFGEICLATRGLRPGFREMVEFMEQSTTMAANYADGVADAAQG